MNLDEELVRHGCPAEAEEFRRLVSSWWESLNPSRTLGEFLTRPGDVWAFCEGMRQLFRCPKLPDDVIVFVLNEQGAGRG